MLKRTIFVVGIVVALLVSGSIAIVYVYEDELKQLAVKELNKYLDAPVKIDRIGLTVWDKFPRASLRFSDVFIPDLLDKSGKDTLIYAQSLYLNFNIWDMLQGNYNVTHIQVERAVVHLKIDSTGKENYIFWKSDTSSAAAGQFKFELQKVALSDTRFTLDVATGRVIQDYTVQTMELSGEFNQRTILLQANTRAVLNRLMIGDATLFTEKELRLHTPLLIDQDSSLLHVKKGNLSLAGLLFEFAGTYHYGESSEIDLAVKGKDIDLISFLKLVPGSLYDDYKSYKSEGIVAFTTLIHGKTAQGEAPEVMVEFGIANGKMTEPSTDITLSQLNLSGTLRYGAGGEKLLVEKIHGLLGGQVFSGNFSVVNFAHPDINAAFEGDIDLGAVKQFFQLNAFEYLEGNARIDGQFGYSFEKDRLKVTRGQVGLKNIAFRMNGEQLNYTDLEGELVLLGNDAALKNFQGKAGASPFSLNGIWRDFLPLVLRKTEKIIIEAEVQSSHVNLDEILHRNTTEQTASHEAFSLPPNIFLNLKFFTENLTYSTFQAVNIHTHILLTPHLFKAENIRLEIAKGEASGVITLEQQHSNLLELTAAGKFTQIDISRFFGLMDNFGQTYITNKHLEGMVSGDLDVFAPMDTLLTLDKNKLLAHSTFTITKGKLKQLSTLQETGDYLDKNVLIKPFINTKELKKKLNVMEIATLTNTISIKNQTIHIPEMVIKSNIMDLHVKGRHRFTDSIDYALNFRLREVLVNKRDAREAAFGPIKDDGLGYRVFVRIAGTVDNPLITLDKEERQEKLREDLQQDKQDLKAVLKQELGLFKKDSSLKYEEKPREEVKFEVEWEDASPQKTPTPQKEEKEKKEKAPDKGLNKLLKKFGEPDPKEKPKIKVEPDGNF